MFIFTANPEDYTNRGSIVTPLKDRIESQILTHYPKSISISKEITQQEAVLAKEQVESVRAYELVKDLIEQIAFEARQSEYVDSKSGVSARLTISAYENLISTAERRLLINNEKETFVRISDFIGVIPAITGKIELVYEGEQEGPSKVAHILLNKAIRTLFLEIFPSPDKIKKSNNNNPYQNLLSWFGKNNLDILTNYSLKEYKKVLNIVPGLSQLVEKHRPKLNEEERLLYMEFVLHGLAEFSLLSKSQLSQGLQFNDMLSTMFTASYDEDDYNETLYK